MALAELARFDSPVAAAIARGRLEAEGIAAIAFDAGLSSLGMGALSPVRLMVDEAELDRARAVLADLA